MTSKVAKAKGAERKQRMDTSSLMEQILSKDNLNAAYLQVIRNKGAAGVDGMTIEELGAYLSENGEIIKEQFHDQSYGFRPNRCAQQAVLKALEMMNDGHSWIVDIDLAKFFDSVDHDKLMTIFGRTIKDGDVISVVRKFLVSGVMIDIACGCVFGSTGKPRRTERKT